MNCGKGITLITDLHKFKEEYFKHKKIPKMPRPSVKKVVTRTNSKRVSDAKQKLPLISSKYAIENQERKKSTSKDIKSRRVNVEKLEEIKEQEKKTKNYTLLKKGVIQKYLQDPLLLEGRKFDYRHFSFF